MRKIALIYLWCCLLQFGGIKGLGIQALLGQVASVQVTINRDSFRLGQEMELLMEVRHSPEVGIIFPDTGAFWSPFEVVARTPFLTRTTDSLTLDRVKYTLRSLVPGQDTKICLPWAAFNLTDTNRFTSCTDTLWFKSLLSAGSVENPMYKAPKQVFYLQDPPNYPVAIGLAILLLFLMMGLYRMFEKPFGRYLELRRIRKQYLTVRKEIHRITRTRLPAIDRVESLGQAWKSYLDKGNLHPYPLATLTTSELIPVIENWQELSSGNCREYLITFSQWVDKIMYAGYEPAANEIPAYASKLELVLEEVYEYRRSLVLAKKSG
ncbi:MAG: hypothetical protein AAGI38_21380 [Bacteroidota bacterium]